MDKETDQPVSATIDLSFDVTEADVTRPVLQSGTYDFTIGFARPSESRQKRSPQLEVGYRLAQVAHDTQGRPVNPNFMIVQRIILKETGGLTKEMIERRLKEIQFATNGASTFTGNTAVWVGKTVRCRVSLREAHKDEATGQEYGESNDIVRVMPAK